MSSNSSVLDISGTVVGGTNCAAADSGNQGCGMRSPVNNSFGEGFNANGGGVYISKLQTCFCKLACGPLTFLCRIVQWDNSGIAVYFFPRGSIPSDISAGSPNPSGWGTPMARWPATSCNPSQFFKQHSVIFDTTLW